MTSEAQPFVHLRLHSAYSLLEGALTIQKLAALARADGRTGARADRLEQSVRRAGILRGARRSRHPADHRPHALADLRRRARHRCSRRDLNGPHADGRIALLAKDAQGYANLMRLSTEVYFAASEIGRGGRQHRPTRRAGRRSDRAHRRARRAGRRGARRRQSRTRPRAVGSAAHDFRRPALCRASAPRPAAGAGGRAATAQARLRPRPAPSSRPTNPISPAQRISRRMTR